MVAASLVALQHLLYVQVVMLDQASAVGKPSLALMGSRFHVLQSCLLHCLVQSAQMKMALFLVAMPAVNAQVTAAIHAGDGRALMVAKATAPPATSSLVVLDA